MTDAELERALQSIGKAAFVLHYDLLSDLRNRRKIRIQELVARTGYAESGAATRVNRAEAIISASRESDAMRIIAYESPRVELVAIAAAKAWLAARPSRS